MGLLDETVEVPRRQMTLFFLLDCSGSMEGQKIGAVNDAVVNVLPIINDISDANPDAEIKIAVLKFASGCDWLYDEPKSIADFAYQDAVAGGLTSLGQACQELASKLSRSGFMKSTSGSYAPSIILLSDGGPTDDYPAELKKLKENNWFKSAIKIAIAIGEDADRDVLKDFTGSSESVLPVHNIEALKQIIRIVAVTSSQIGSKSSSAGDATKQEQVVKEIQEAAKDIDGVETSDANSTASVDSSQYIDDWG